MFASLSAELGLGASVQFEVDEGVSRCQAERAAAAWL